MKLEDLESIVRAAGIDTSLMRMGAASCIASEGCHGVTVDDLQKIVDATLELAARGLDELFYYSASQVVRAARSQAEGGKEGT